ncbi:hypothetical protein BQ8794_140143 [Mesorhizobium prunaredense]|uniref:Uncharacterized protein n=1 Tax=Mesorhizobium prunaredense TaxID=1631249 RepID=A0A1R3V456_9HYPH|nr:hypothetical protein BQ8794_140143 [Mesorhizobium prunaredense]
MARNALRDNRSGVRSSPLARLRLLRPGSASGKKVSREAYPSAHGQLWTVLTLGEGTLKANVRLTRASAYRFERLDGSCVVLRVELRRMDRWAHSALKRGDTPWRRMAGLESDLRGARRTYYVSKRAHLAQALPNGFWEE